MFQNSGREGPHQTIASKIQTEGPVGECPGSDVSHSTMRGLVRKMIGPVFPVAAGWIPRTTYAGHEDVRYRSGGETLISLENLSERRQGVTEAQRTGSVNEPGEPRAPPNEPGEP